MSRGVTIENAACRSGSRQNSRKNLLCFNGAECAGKERAVKSQLNGEKQAVKNSKNYQRKECMLGSRMILRQNSLPLLALLPSPPPRRIRILDTPMLSSISSTELRVTLTRFRTHWQSPDGSRRANVYYSAYYMKKILHYCASSQNSEYCAGDICIAADAVAVAVC